MLPGNALSTSVVQAPFLVPRGTLRSAADRALNPQSVGGAGFRDTTQGLASQIWTGTYDGLNLVLSPQVGTPIAVFTQPNVVWFDFCFDQSMNQVVAYADNLGNVGFYWFDSTIPGFTTTLLPFGTDPWPFCQLDDTRPSQSSNSDVIVTYTRASHLYFRAQRDRFLVEYDLGVISVDPPKVLVAAGLNTGGRFQFEFAQILPNLSFAYARFVGSKVFKAVEISRVGNIKPRLWPSKKNNTVLA